MLYKKILLKISFIFPFYFLLIYLVSSISENSWAWTSMVITALVISSIQIFSNIFDYDYYNTIEPKDYLESKHHFQSNYSTEKWMKIQNLESVHNHKLKKIENTDQFIKYELILTKMNSTITFQRNGDLIELYIQKKFFSFLPDKAVNYKSLKKLLLEIENPENL